MSMVNFRLVSEVRAFIAGKLIYLVSPDDKASISKLKKSLKDITNLKEYQISADNFKIRLSDIDNSLVLSTDDLPGEYHLGNLDESCIWDLVRYVKVDSGNLLGDYSIAVSKSITSESIDPVRIISPDMPFYSDYLDEMIRRINFTAGKKTRKYIPGHRYDSESETLYYLGSVYSRLSTPQNDDFANYPEKEVALFTKNIGDCKTLSEVFQNGILSEITDGILDFGKFFKITAYYSKALLVDCGEVLKNDCTIFDHLESIFDNSQNLFYERSKDKYVKGSPYLTNVFTVFKYTDETKTSYSVSPDLINKLRAVVSDAIMDRTLYAWESQIGRPMKEGSEKNYENCILGIIGNLLDPNIKRFTYYYDLVGYLGIDLKELFDNVVSFGVSSLSQLKNHIKYDRGENFVATYRTELSSNYTLTKYKISDKISDTDLAEVIKSMCLDARENHGISIEEYEILTTSRSKQPYESFKVTVEDIVAYYNKEKGIEVPENLKEGILKSNFKSIIVTVDKGAVIE